MFAHQLSLCRAALGFSLSGQIKAMCAQSVALNKVVVWGGSFIVVNLPPQTSSLYAVKNFSQAMRANTTSICLSLLCLLRGTLSQHICVKLSDSGKCCKSFQYFISRMICKYSQEWWISEKHFWSFSCLGHKFSVPDLRGWRPRLRAVWNRLWRWDVRKSSLNPK